MSDIRTLLRPEPRPGIAGISPYVPGKSSAPGVARVFKLSSNETPLGPSPKALAAYRAAADLLHYYPEGSSRVLREAIGALNGLDPARIICGAGSDELLNLLAHAFVGPGDETIMTAHGFLVYPIATRAAGGTPVVVPETNLTADVDAILAHVTPSTRIVFIANPNNPTGTYVPADAIRRLLAELPPQVLLVLDAAYTEYVTANDYSGGLALVDQYPNVVVTRTFSKIYGLANLRIGWLYGTEHLVDALNRIRGPFNVSGPGMLAAVAGLEDQEHIAKAVAHNTHWRAWLSKAISDLDLVVTPSAANFVLLHFPDMPGRSAEDADRFLTERGLILRGVASYGLGNSLRMTVGSEEANRLVVQALTEFVETRHG